MGICMGAIFCAQFRTWFLSWLFFPVGHKIFRLFFILITTKQDQTNNAEGKRTHEAQVEEEKRTFNKNRDLYASNTENFWLQEIANSWWYTHTHTAQGTSDRGRKTKNELLIVFIKFISWIRNYLFGARCFCFSAFVHFSLLLSFVILIQQCL